MASLKLLANICFIFTAITAHIINDNAAKILHALINYRLPRNIIPVHYNIKIIPYIEENNFTFDGECNINIKILRPTQNISLHALKLTIHEKATTLTHSNGTSYAPVAHFYNNISEILTLNFNIELIPEFYILNMKFVGILHENIGGIYRTSYENKAGNTVWMVATQFEPTWARLAFPCWDEPALKATFDISIKHHKVYTALSNMPVKMQLVDDNQNDMLWTHFDTTPLMSTYIVAFVVADYVRIPTEDKTINLWCRSQLVPNSKLMREVVVKSELLMEKYINISHMVPKMDHVAIPVEFSAMENWGLIIYGEKYFAYDATSNTTTDKHEIALTVTHEIAHQWFGNIASPVWWSYLWLKEGFATYFEVYFTDQMFENWRLMDLSVVKHQQSVFQTDAGNNIMPVTSEVNSPSEIQTRYSSSSYGKAPAIIRMLHHILTDKVFRKGLHNFVQTHQFFTATPKDLWFALQTTLDESKVPHDKYRLKEVMDTWTKQKHYPLVTVNRDYKTEETIVRQQPFRSYIWSNEEDIDTEENIEKSKWWIPLSYATQTNRNFYKTLPRRWLRPQDQSFTIYGIDKNDWIILNIQQTAYYIVNYDEENWQRIANYLNSDKYMEIHVLNRAQIISDAFYLLAANQLPVSVFFNLMHYIPRETDYIVWYPVFIIFDTIWKVFNTRNNIFLRYLYQIFDAFIKKIGYGESPTEDDLTKLTRIKVLEWACTFQHTECRQIATLKLNQHLTDPETYKIPPNLEKWTYCMGMMAANLSTWNILFNIYLNNPSNNKIVDYLSCSENPDIFFNLLNVSTVNNVFMDDDNSRKIFYAILSSQINHNKVFDYMLENLKDPYITRHIGKYFILNAMITKATSQQQLHKIREFLENNLTQKSALEHFQNLLKEKESQFLKNAEKYASLRKAIFSEFK